MTPTKMGAAALRTRTAPALAALAVTALALTSLGLGTAARAETGMMDHGMAMPMAHGEGMGAMLTDAAGMTLYTFDKDKDGMSACYDACATNWPPALAEDKAMAHGDFAMTERKDGAQQWTYKGMPLYTWAKDKAAGDMTGDGMNGVWHVAKP